MLKLRKNYSSNQQNACWNIKVMCYANKSGRKLVSRASETKQTKRKQIIKEKKAKVRHLTYILFFFFPILWSPFVRGPYLLLCKQQAKNWV